MQFSENTNLARASKLTDKITKVISWGILLSVAFPLGVFMFLARYVRYFADDFSTAGVVVNQGFWQAQVYWYRAWTGSFLYTFLTSLAELGGVRVAQVLPILAMTLWMILLVKTFGLIFRVIDISDPGVWRGIISLVIVFCTIRGFKDYTEVIFWQTGIIAYQSNLIIFILIAAYFINRFWIERGDPPLRREPVAMFFLFFLAGGISETWVVMQVALFTLGGLAVVALKRGLVHEGLFRMLVVGFLASCLSLFVTLLAPGNANHAPSMDALSVGRIIHFLFVSLGDVPRFLFEWISGRTIPFALITVTGFICGFMATGGVHQNQTATRLKFGILIFTCGLLALWVGLFPGYVVFGVRPPDRAIFTAMFIFLWTYTLLMFVLGWTASSSVFPVSRSFARAVLTLLLVPLVYLSPIQTGLSQVRLIPVYRLYAQLWDARDASLVQAGEQGQTDVVVQSIRLNPALSDLQETIWIAGELEEGPENWKNRAAAKYYGLGSITGKK